MADEPHGFTQARARLEEIVSQVRKKDTSLEKSLDLLEEGVRLANQCTELIDHADWEAAAGSQASSPADGDAPAADDPGEADDAGDAGDAGDQGDESAEVSSESDGAISGD